MTQTTVSHVAGRSGAPPHQGEMFGAFPSIVIRDIGSFAFLAMILGLSVQKAADRGTSMQPRRNLSPRRKRMHRSEIGRRQSRSNACEHPGSDLLIIVEGKHEVRASPRGSASDANPMFVSVAKERRSDSAPNFLMRSLKRSI